MPRLPTDLVGYILDLTPHVCYVQHMLNHANRAQYTIRYTAAQRRLHYLAYVLHPHIHVRKGVIQLTVPGSIPQYRYNNVLSLYLFVLGCLGVHADIEESSKCQHIAVRTCHLAGTLAIRGPGPLPIPEHAAGIQFCSYVIRAIRRCHMPMLAWTCAYYRTQPPVPLSTLDLLDGVEITEAEAMEQVDRYEAQVVTACMLPYPRVVERVLRNNPEHGNVWGDLNRGRGLTRWPPERLYPTILVILRLCRRAASMLYSDLFTGCWEYIAHHAHLHECDWGRTLRQQVAGILHNHGPIRGIAEILRHLHAEHWDLHRWGQIIGYHSLADRGSDIFDYPIPAHVAWHWVRYWGTDSPVSQYIDEWARTSGIRYYPEGAAMPKSGDPRAWR